MKNIKSVIILALLFLSFTISVYGSVVQLVDDDYHFDYSRIELKCVHKGILEYQLSTGAIVTVKDPRAIFLSTAHLNSSYHGLFEVDGVNIETGNRLYFGSLTPLCKWNNEDSLLCADKTETYSSTANFIVGKDGTKKVVLEYIFASGTGKLEFDATDCFKIGSYPMQNKGSVKLLETYLYKQIDQENVKFRVMKNDDARNPYRIIVSYYPESANYPCYYLSMPANHEIWARAYCDSTGYDSPDYPDMSSKFYEFDIDGDGDLDVFEMSADPDYPLSKFVITLHYR